MADNPDRPWRFSELFQTTPGKVGKLTEKPRKYLVLVGGDVGPWEAFHMGPKNTDNEIIKHMEELKELYPDLEVRLYLCETGIELSSTKEKPYKRIKKLKHVVKSSAEWIKEGHRTAICNLCGEVGPTVPMTQEGNRILAKAGWFKEEGEAAFSMMSFFGGGSSSYKLFCPRCDETESQKDVKEDWFT